jgi:hypothetical protein
MMERSNWGLKSGQEYILAVRITRQGWEEALNASVLTTFNRRVYKDRADWQQQFDHALVYVQWDPERTIHGTSLPQRSIQVGLSRHIISRYVDDWIVEIRDETPLVHKIHHLLRSGYADKARDLLPHERVYPVDTTIARRLDMSQP